MKFRYIVWCGYYRSNCDPLACFVRLTDAEYYAYCWYNLYIKKDVYAAVYDTVAEEVVSAYFCIGEA